MKFYCHAILVLIASLFLPDHRIEAARLARTVSAIADTFGSGDNAFEVEFVSIGDRGNVADSGGYPDPGGAVDYLYRIGKHEVSRDMIDKANAEGRLGITLADMSSEGGNGENKPATGISWYEATRFVNWLNISSGFQPAYKFNGGDFELWQPADAGYDESNRFRNRFARYVLPTLDEWYKAAYYDPSDEIYYDFATGSDTAPTPVINGTEPNTAVYLQSDIFVDEGPAEITLAGGLSPYGTVGQSGNVWEWIETEVDLVNDEQVSSNAFARASPPARSIRGGNWNSFANVLGVDCRCGFVPTNARNFNGFRVASVPEPGAMVMVWLGMLGLFTARHHTSRHRSGVA